MKKVLSILLTCGILLSISACAKQTPASSAAGPSSTAKSSSIAQASSTAVSPSAESCITEPAAASIENFVPCNNAQECTLPEHHPYVMGRLDKLETEVNASYAIFGELEKVLTDEERILYFASDKNVGMHKSREVFKDLSSMLLSLQSGRIDICSVPTLSAEYIVSRNKDIKMLHLADMTEYAAKNSMELIPASLGSDPLSYCMATLPSNTALRDKINSTLATLEKNGQLDVLSKKYIDDCIAGKDYTPDDMPVFPGKDTIRVAITGDLPPLDYVSTGGLPAGYNVALLSEISKILEVNIEMVSVTSDARLPSLASGKVDAVFWISIPNFPGLNLNDPKEIILSDSYYNTTQAYIYTDYPLDFIARYEGGAYSPSYLKKMVEDQKKADSESSAK